MAGNRFEDCLIELGMEELPPKAVLSLQDAFAAAMRERLTEARLAFSDIQAFAAPRRLALLIVGLQWRQDDERQILRGPPVSVAFDDAGDPTRAAMAFAAKAGVDVAELGRETSDKGEWLKAEKIAAGQPASELLPSMVQASMERLPIPRRMRWGSHDYSFIRPLHWLVMLHGDDVIDGQLLGINAGRQTRGHRFHSHGPLTIERASDYADVLRGAYCEPDFAIRRERVWAAAEQAAAQVSGRIIEDADLLDEVTALCDWPVAVVGGFDARFLQLPEEVLVSTLKVHQRYFPVYDSARKPLAYFVTIANIESREPDEVRRGNERVVAPRLSDAEFFWQHDRQKSLSERQEGLDRVVYQKALGSIGDKMRRVGALAASICSQVGADDVSVQRAVSLMRCDLLTDMVGEFPELQGVMGGYYAALDGESEAVCTAIRDQYLPAFAGDRIADGATGKVIGVADRIDMLAGIFSIGKRPSGNRDPFGLRRAALGLLRILIEGRLDIDLPALIKLALSEQPVATDDKPELADDIYDFVLERLRGYYQSDLCAGRVDLFEAVLARQPHSMLDFDQRLRAVTAFVNEPAAQALASSNKRIANILRSAGVDAGAVLDVEALTLEQEVALAEAWQSAAGDLRPLVRARDYPAALLRLSRLQPAVDAFFDHVMVMDEDPEKRRNRIALLSEVRGLFLQIADISLLVFAGE